MEPEDEEHVDQAAILRNMYYLQDDDNKIKVYKTNVGDVIHKQQVFSCIGQQCLTVLDMVDFYSVVKQRSLIHF
jgi:hypothetical protein